MYFLNVSALAESLKLGKVSQRDKMLYYLLLCLDLFRANDSGFEIKSIGTTYALMEMFIITVGILLCYKINQLGDNEHFVDRMVCLSWPISCHINIIKILLIIIIAPEPSNPDSKLASDIFLFLLHIGLQLASFAVLYYYIRDVSGANRKNDTVTPPSA